MVSDLQVLCKVTLEDYFKEILEAASIDEDLDSFCDSAQVCGRAVQRALLRRGVWREGRWR